MRMFWGKVWAGETNVGAVMVALKAMRLDANTKGQSIDRKQDQRLNPWAGPQEKYREPAKGTEK